MSTVIPALASPDADLPRPTRDVARLRHDLFTSGYCLIERALEDVDLEAVQTRLMEQAAAERLRHDLKNPANPQKRNQWVGMLLNKGDIFFDLVRHPIAMPLVQELLGRDYVISCVDAQIQHPGSTVMPLHTDQWWMPPPVEPGAAHRPPAEISRATTHTSRDPRPASRPISSVMCANVMWMVTDFTEATGATRVVPGSHLSGFNPDPAVPHPVSTVAATGPAGTAFVFDGRLWHGGGANTTDKPRYGITSNYCAPQCRQLENYTRGMRPDVLARCPPEVRERLGFRVWRGYGHTGDPDADYTRPGDEALGELAP